MSSHRNYDQTLTLTTGAGRVSLGVSAAEKVWVKSVNGKLYPKTEGPFVLLKIAALYSKILYASSTKVINRSLCPDVYLR